MPVNCPPNYSPNPDHSLPSKPDDSTTVDEQNGTYKRTKYDWIKVSNIPNISVGCGQTLTFFIAYSVTVSGEVSAKPFGIGASTGGSDTNFQQIRMTLASTTHEYVAIGCYLNKTVEKGTVTDSGGFVGSGFFDRLRFGWRFLRSGPAAIIPVREFSAPDSSESTPIQVAIKVCQKPCKVATEKGEKLLTPQ